MLGSSISLFLDVFTGLKKKGRKTYKKTYKDTVPTTDHGQQTLSSSSGDGNSSLYSYVFSDVCNG